MCPNSNPMLLKNFCYCSIWYFIIQNQISPRVVEKWIQRTKSLEGQVTRISSNEASNWLLKKMRYEGLNIVKVEPSYDLLVK